MDTFSTMGLPVDLFLKAFELVPMAIAWAFRAETKKAATELGYQSGETVCVNGSQCFQISWFYLLSRAMYIKLLHGFLYLVTYCQSCRYTCKAYFICLQVVTRLPNGRLYAMHRTTLVICLYKPNNPKVSCTGFLYPATVECKEWLVSVAFRDTANDKTDYMFDVVPEPFVLTSVR